MQLIEAKETFLQHLADTGKSERTLYTYAKDLDYFIAGFKPEREIASIRLTEIGKWLKSDSYLLTPKQKYRSERSLEKNQRVVRQWFVWAKAQGLIDELPLPKSIPMGWNAELNGPNTD